LRCSYCDTAYAYEEGKEKTISVLIDEISRFDCDLVEVTGGEPLLQNDTPLLVEALLEKDYRVLLETNGSLDIGRVSNRCVRIVDFKCPSSGMAFANNYNNLHNLTPIDEVKFVIGDREDFGFARELTRQIQSAVSPRVTIHFAPVFDTLKPSELAHWILKERIKVHLQLQLHRIIWPSLRKGV
jgi:7-carboxy-7-deazaguanine synthase